MSDLLEDDLSLDEKWEMVEKILWGNSNTN